MARPKISTTYPFDYDKVLKQAKYLFLYDKCGNQGNDTRPRIVTGEKDGMIVGYGIGIYNNGIEINSEFSMPKHTIDMDSITKNVNKGICDWLKSLGEDNLIIKAFIPSSECG